METASTTPATTPAPTESCGMTVEPRKEHLWLRQLIGEWTFESECAGEPGQPSQTFRGSESVRPFGDLWIIGEGEGEMPGGGAAKMLITLGYDVRRNSFVGSWLGSMMTHLWNYEGQLDASGRVLTLDAEGPSFTDPQKLAKYQDIIEVVSEDHRILRSQTLSDNGTWNQFMTAHYRRKK